MNCRQSPPSSLNLWMVVAAVALPFIPPWLQWSTAAGPRSTSSFSSCAMKNEALELPNLDQNPDLCAMPSCCFYTRPKPVLFQYMSEDF